MTSKEPDADVLVVGAGPVGLAAAIAARRRGLSVIVTDPRADPIDKACGEGLMPAGVARLSALLAADATRLGRPLAGIRYLDAAGRQAEARFRRGPGLGIRRLALQEALAEAAYGLGARRAHRRVEAIEQDGGGPGGGLVRAAGLAARYLVAADGLHSSARRLVGARLPVRGVPRYGLRRHYAVAPWSGFVEVHWGRRAEAYVTPVGKSCVGVALLVRGRPAGGFDEVLAEFPKLLDRLGDASAATPVRGAGPLRQRARSRVTTRVLLVGDAAGYVDALTGEGLSLGFAEAAAAVDAIASGRPGAYELAWRGLTRRYRWTTTALVAVAGWPAMRGRVVATAGRLPGTFSFLVNHLG